MAQLVIVDLCNTCRLEETTRGRVVALLFSIAANWFRLPAYGPCIRPQLSQIRSDWPIFNLTRSYRRVSPRSRKTPPWKKLGRPMGYLRQEEPLKNKDHSANIENGCSVPKSQIKGFDRTD